MRVSANSYYDRLCEWQDWFDSLGMEHLKGGSEKDSLEPGQWMVQSYGFEAGRRVPWDHRLVCLHPRDRMIAILFKLVWT